LSGASRGMLIPRDVHPPMIVLVDTLGRYTVSVARTIGIEGIFVVGHVILPLGTVAPSVRQHGTHPMRFPRDALSFPSKG
jgi:hypothetical protein